MGRIVANEDFLRALLRNNPYDQYHFYLHNQKQIDTLKAKLDAEFPNLDIRYGFWLNLPEILKKTRFEVFHLSDWVVGFVPLAVLRNKFSRHIFPITGPIHSISYARYHSEFLNHMWPGCTGRDAIIVTSRAGKAVVSEAFRELRENYQLPVKFFHPELIQIPLGISEFPDAEKIVRLSAMEREALGLAPNEIMLLYLGRISHDTKKDMLPLLRVLKRVGAMGVELAKVRLVLAGWIDDDDKIESRLKEFAKALSINLTVISRPDNARRSGLYAAADIFVSLVDNLQETFGITMLEAGAYGLPVVASDFDGYRDLVVDGKSGYLVPSLGPRQTEQCDALAHFWADSPFHLLFAQQSVVDIPKAASCLASLIKDSALRKQMGEAGRQLVSSNFSWDAIIPQYVKIWDELSRKALEPEALACSHPMQLSYERLFRVHFSGQLHDDLQIVWTRSGEAFYRGLENAVIYEGTEDMLPLDSLNKLMFLARKPVRVADLVQSLISEGLDGEHADYLLLWALKHDFLEVFRSESFNFE